MSNTWPQANVLVCRVSADGKPKRERQTKKGKPPTGAGNVTTMTTENVNDGDDESSPTDEDKAADLPVTTNPFGRMFSLSTVECFLLYKAEKVDKTMSMVGKVSVKHGKGIIQILYMFDQCSTDH